MLPYSTPVFPYTPPVLPDFAPKPAPTTCPAVCEQTGCVCVHAWAGCPSEVRCLFPLVSEEV